MSENYTIPPPNIESVDLQLKKFITQTNQKLTQKFWKSQSDNPIIERIPDAILVDNPLLLAYVFDLRNNNYAAKIEQRGDYAWWHLIIKPSHLVQHTKSQGVLSAFFCGGIRDFYT